MDNTLKKFYTISGILLLVGLVWIVVVWQGENPAYNLPPAERPVLGNPNASIVVEEFSDFQCPACRSAAPVVKGIVNKYKDKIKFVYRHFPLLSIHPRAYDAALASECANDQGKFWQYHDILFANQPDFKKDQLIGYARDLGLNESEFSACLQSRARKEVVDADLNKAKELNLNSTPTFIVNGKIIRNWSTGLEAAIVAEIDKQSNANAN